MDSIGEITTFKNCVACILKKIFLKNIVSTFFFRFVTTDLDEFIDVKDQEASKEEYPLRSFLKKVEKRSKIGALRLERASFGSSKEIDGDTPGPFHLFMDYTTKLDDMKHCGSLQTMPKLIYNAQVSEAAGVHWNFRGGKIENMDPQNRIMIHHNPRPLDYNGKKSNTATYTLNKPNCTIKDSTIADKYRSKVCHKMNDYLGRINVSDIC